ncbi:MAG: hypothetical protein NC432_14215 [Roseburia sp.]|nr:hypothetical protein [Roseburia sp.]MCM1099603.1 hypothetical protein [Ruminococcus flavefaciens]
MKKKKMILAALGLAVVLAGCGARGAETPPSESGQVEGESAENGAADAEEVNCGRITVDESVTYQTMESFGTSGCWWSQYVGGFTKDANGTGGNTREDIATLLFDREKGIGLTCYRYNLGAGSVESKTGTFWDPHRKAQCFETEPGVYDFTKDANAVWFLEKACELGVEEVIFFCNSPLVRLTDNGLPHMTEGGSRSNISPEKYPEWAKYCMDVIEHFVEEGIPVKFLSPINEPQWDWYNGQEGCHYAKTEVAKVYTAFLDELESRPALADVKLAGPESGEWKGDAVGYSSAILNNARLREHFDAIDNHSYWSDASDKKSFKNWMTVHYPDVKIRASEWCEMVNGSDFSMDSAIHIAQEIAEDLRILDVVSWQNWVGVAPGGYRDGLIYVDESSQKYRALKRLWSYGNYSRYVRPGYVRVDVQTQEKDHEAMFPVAFTGTNDNGEQELVMVLINDKTKDGQEPDEKTTKEEYADQEFLLTGAEGYSRIAMYVTSEDYDLECVLEEEFDPAKPVTVPGGSVTTVVLTK